MNDYIDACRRNYHAGAKLKKEMEFIVTAGARKALRKWRAAGPVVMRYDWYEPNKRRDKDNVSGFGRKIIQDALVSAQFLKNDGWNDIEWFFDVFHIDKKDPRVEITIYEEGDEYEIEK